LLYPAAAARQQQQVQQNRTAAGLLMLAQYLKQTMTASQARANTAACWYQRSVVLHRLQRQNQQQQ
jgi:hypothetical protein